MNPSKGRALYNMEEPLCLIENSVSGGILVNQEAVNFLSGINQPVVVVAIVGLYRTGKSYLMNKLARKRKGFSLGSTIQSHTKGIWMWCMPHPLKADHCLILLDTEGLGDVEKGNEKNDCWIFALAVLLSSVLVYNSLGTIDQNAMNNLHYVTELSELIKVKSAGEDEESSEFTRFFPALIWTVRDFTLQLKLDGREVTADGYFDNALKLKHGISKQIQAHNLPRECIRNYFPTRKCFVFDRPADKAVMQNMDQCPDSSLDPNFLKQARDFVDYVYHTAQIKKLKGGHTVSGRMLGTLALTYVDSIRNGTIPCLESAAHALAQIENKAAVIEATEAYEEMMRVQIRLPTGTVQELSKIHDRCQSKALQLFMKRCFQDQGQRYQQELMNAVARIYSSICEKNSQESMDKSIAIIEELGATMEDKIEKGSYTKPGGYTEFEKDMETLVERYRATPGKGVQADQVIQAFLERQMKHSQFLRQFDATLTARDKEIAADRERSALKELARKVKEEESRAAQQLLEDKNRALEENLRQQREKAEQDRLNFVQEQEKFLQQRLLEQEKLLKEGFQSRVAGMQPEIDSLKKQLKAMETPSFVDMCLDTAMLVAPGYYRVIPFAGKVGINVYKKFVSK